MALFDCFKRKAPSDRPKPDGSYDQEGKPSEDVVTEEDRYQRIALIVGHTESDKGATTYSFNGKKIAEYDYNKARAEQVKQILDTEYHNKVTKIFYRDGIGRKGVAKQVGEWKADVSLELHLNSVGSSYDAYGCEMLVLKGDHESATVGRKFTDALHKHFGSKIRRDNGIKWMDGERGTDNLSYVKRYGTKIRLLIEPFFCGTETKESKQFVENPKKYSRVLADVLGNLK